MRLLNSCALCVREKASQKHGLIVLPSTQLVSSKKVIVLEPGKCITRGGTILESQVETGDRVLVHQGDQGPMPNLKAWKDLEFELKAAIVPETVDYIKWLKEALPDSCSVTVRTDNYTEDPSRPHSLEYVPDSTMTIVIHVNKGTPLQILYQSEDLKLVIPYGVDVPDRNIKESV